MKCAVVELRAVSKWLVVNFNLGSCKISFLKKIGKICLACACTICLLELVIWQFFPGPFPFYKKRSKVGSPTLYFKRFRVEISELNLG